MWSAFVRFPSSDPLLCPLSDCDSCLVLSKEDGIFLIAQQCQLLSLLTKYSLKEGLRKNWQMFDGNLGGRE